MYIYIYAYYIYMTYIYISYIYIYYIYINIYNKWMTITASWLTLFSVF